MTEKLPRRPKPRTLAAQALGTEDPITKAIVPPLHVATTFIRDPDNQYRSGYIYGRPDNATVRQAEARDRHARRGAMPRCCSGPAWRPRPRSCWRSRRAPCRRAQSHVLGVAQLARLTRRDAIRPWRSTSSTPPTSTAVRAAVRPGKTKLVWIETPANPLWTITDIAARGRDRASRPARASPSTSTVATPVLTRPLALGADLVMHSATKYLNGHSDVIAGALAAAATDANSGERIKRMRAQRGGDPRAVRGVAAAARHADAAFARARSSAERADARRRISRITRSVAQVLYPGLPSHPGHEVAARQMSGGFGGMLSIRVTRRRGGRDRDRGEGRALEARDLARRRRKPDRAPRVGRGTDRLARPTCCGSRPASKTRTTFMRISIGRYAEPMRSG